MAHGRKTNLVRGSRSRSYQGSSRILLLGLLCCGGTYGCGSGDDSSPPAADAASDVRAEGSLGTGGRRDSGSEAAIGSGGISATEVGGAINVGGSLIGAGGTVDFDASVDSGEFPGDAESDADAEDGEASDGEAGVGGTGNPGAGGSLVGVGGSGPGSGGHGVGGGTGDSGLGGHPGDSGLGGHPSDSGLGGSHAGGSHAGGSNAGGSHAGGSNSGGSHAGGSNSGGSNAGGSNAGGSAGKGGSNSGGSNAGGSGTGGANAGGANTGGSGKGGAGTGGSLPDAASLVVATGTVYDAVSGTATVAGATVRFLGENGVQIGDAAVTNSSGLYAISVPPNASGFIKIDMVGNYYGRVRQEYTQPANYSSTGIYLQPKSEIERYYTDLGLPAHAANTGWIWVTISPTPFPERGGEGATVAITPTPTTAPTVFYAGYAETLLGNTLPPRCGGDAGARCYSGTNSSGEIAFAEVTGTSFTVAPVVASWDASCVVYPDWQPPPASWPLFPDTVVDVRLTCR